ncbi:MAG: hypothetical protein NZM04_00145, partial [Methylacidiphilales bacterium]|nr:hypothetical protein [Candidatus Methylacidiphilales bacterium]
VVGYLWWKVSVDGIVPSSFFYCTWLMGAVVVAGIFWVFIRPRYGWSWRKSERYRQTILCCVPAGLCGILIPLWLMLTNYPQTWIAMFWILFYGLALLSLPPYAPQGLYSLGWAFLVCGLVAVAVVLFGSAFVLSDTNTALLFMFGTFGLLHLLYGVSVKLSLQQAPIEDGKEDE